MDKAVCDINKGTLHPYHAEDKGGEYEKGKDTCRKLGFESCGSDSCTVLKD